jgi:hypothetical protein
MGGPTVVITAAPSASSTIISSSVNGAARLARWGYVGRWGRFLCAVGTGAVVVLGGVW